MAAIDIGPGAIDRVSFGSSGYTYVEGGNPANATGKINTVEFWFTTKASNVEAATFFVVSGNYLSTRDSETIGSVTAGSKQTFAGLDMSVTSGDYIGLYCTAGYIEAQSSGGDGHWYVNADKIPCTNQLFAWWEAPATSIYGTGVTGVAWTKSLSDTVAIADSIKKGIGVKRADNVALADSFGRQVDFVRTPTDTVAIADVISKAIEIPLGDAVAITEAALVKDIGKGLADQVVITDSFTRVVNFLRDLSDTVDITDSVSKAVSIPLSDVVAIADAISKEPGLVLADQVTIADAISKQFGLTLADSVAIADVIIKLRNMVSVRTLGFGRLLEAVRNLPVERIRPPE